jgi:hypothetical protein
MTKCTFCYANLIDSATLTPSSQDPSFPVTNIQHRWITKTWRSVSSGGTLSANIVIDFTTPKSVRAFFLFPHNFSPQAVVKIQANTTDSWGSPAIDQTAVLGKIIYYFWNTPQSYRFWRVVITDPNPVTTYLEIGRMFLGNYFEPSINISNNYQLLYADSSDIMVSDGGQITSAQKARYKTYQIKFETLPAADKNALVNIFSERGKALDWIFISNRDDVQNTFVYCRFSTDLNIEHLWGEQYFNVSFSIEELR